MLGAFFALNTPDSWLVKHFDSPTFDPAVIGGEDREVENSFSFPSLATSFDQEIGPNALFTPVGVPEGGSTALLMAMAIAVVFVLRGCSPERFRG